MMIRLLLIACFAFFSTFLISPVFDAHARDDGNGTTTEENKPKKGILPRHYYVTGFFHDSSDPENIFYLRLMNQGVVSGCFRVSKASYDIKNKGVMIKLDVVDQEIRIRKYQPRYTNYDCKLKYASAIIDVKLDRDELIANGVTKISLNSKKYGEFGAVDIKVTKSKIELTAAVEDPEYIDYLWFFPENTVVLHTPKAKQADKKVQDLIREYGISQGFVPMEEVLENYELPYNAYDYVMFTDPSGAVRNQLGTPRDQLPIGHITPTRTIHGSEGLYEEPYELEVFASIPGHEAVTRDSFVADKD